MVGMFWRFKNGKDMPPKKRQTDGSLIACMRYIFTAFGQFTITGNCIGYIISSR